MILISALGMCKQVSIRPAGLVLNMLDALCYNLSHFPVHKNFILTSSSE